MRDCNCSKCLTSLETKSFLFLFAHRPLTLNAVLSSAIESELMFSGKSETAFNSLSMTNRPPVHFNL